MTLQFYLDLHAVSPTGAEIRYAALDAMLAMQQAPTADSDHAAISAIFAANGWPISGGYTGRRGDEYCGHTVAVAFRRVGEFVRPGQCVDLSIHPELARRTLASTLRLADLGPDGSRWRDHGLTRPSVEFDDIQPGDIVVVVTSAGKSVGDHIVMALTALDSDGVFDTVEGNATGQLGNGKRGKGVVARQRSLSGVRQVLRLGREHCVGNALDTLESET